MTPWLLPGRTGCRRQVREEGARRGCGSVPCRVEAEGGRDEISSCPAAGCPRGRKPVGTHFASVWRAEFRVTHRITARRSPTVTRCSCSCRTARTPCLFLKSISFGKSVTATAVCMGAVTAAAFSPQHAGMSLTTPCAKSVCPGLTCARALLPLPD